MCIIAYKEQGSILTDDQLKKCWDLNPDGAGFTIFNDGKQITHKGYMKFSKFLKAFKRHQGHIKETDSIAHFRIATSGGISAEMTHPFFRTKDLVLYHNGIVDFYGSKKKSDTKDLFFNVLRHIPSTNARIKLLESYTDTSRFCMIDKGMIHLIGDWIDKDGILYSNDRPFPKIQKFTSDLIPSVKNYWQDNDLDDYLNFDLADGDRGICYYCGQNCDVFAWDNGYYCEDCLETGCY